MADLLEFLSTNAPAALGVSIALLVVGVTISILYAIAFAQGRSVSFWPPSIGARPATPEPDKSKDKDGDNGPDATSRPAETQNPVVDRGTMLVGASGASYRVSSTFYGGANATLYKTSDPKNNTVIAKVFWRGLIPNSPSWELFRQEQRAAEILQHRNIARTLDRGLRSGYPFTILEYFGGGTLRDWLRTHDRLPGNDILSIASQLADAIDFAHSRGVIHRDIKPGNVLFESDADGRVALSDFGIAAIMGAVERDITAAGGYVGSPGYLAPELIQGALPTSHADVYSFGVVLYEMIAMRVPFDEKQEVLAFMKAKVESDAPDIRQLRPDVDEKIASRLVLALAREPAQRPASARALLAGIEDSLRRL
jgi:eukaryotic-like serine/threonine-protein kinase